MPKADLVSIQDDSGCLRFTRLSALGRFGGTEERSVKAFESLDGLINQLTSDHFLVVDCSHFEPLASRTSETLVNLFATVAKRPTILLRNCSTDFVAKYEKIADGFREQTRLPPNSTTLQRANHQLYLKELASDLVCPSDYLVVPRDVAQPSLPRIEAALNLENDYLRHAVRQSTRLLVSSESSGRLRSTPLRSSHYVDCSTVVGTPFDYIWFVSRLATDLLNLVALVLDRHVEDGLQSTPRLLACTRNGVALASSIQSFLAFYFGDNLRLDVVDRFGPTQRMVEEYDGGDSQESEGQKWYIYVGDIAIGGTELKIAEAHSHYRGVPLMGGLVVGSVLTFLEGDDARLVVKDSIGSRFSVFPLVHLLELELETPLSYQFP